jgi:hypothetical protein
MLPRITLCSSRESRTIRDMSNEPITSEEIKAFALAHQITLAELAAFVPMSERTLYGWSTGRYKVPTMFRRVLADVGRELDGLKEKYANHGKEIDANHALR